MKTALHILLFTLTGLSVFGQRATTLSGTVQDASGKPLSFATTALFSEGDTTRLAKATATDAEGQFAFENVRTGQYIVRATAVGFQKVYSTLFEVGSAPTRLPALTLPELIGKLAEVQVTAKKPFVEQQIGRMVVNVEGSIIGSGSTALEVLQKAPGVTVDYQNDLIQLKGKDGVIVQIDGKQSYLS